MAEFKLTIGDGLYAKLQRIADSENASVDRIMRRAFAVEIWRNGIVPPNRLYTATDSGLGDAPDVATLREVVIEG